MSNQPAGLDGNRLVRTTGPCWRVRRFAAGLSVVAMAALAGGCTPADAGKSLRPVADWVAFQEEVLQSSQPVLIEFSKEPCPPCVTQKAELDKLSSEFGGRIVFASMTLMKGDFVILCPEVRSRYHIFWVPTTILFVNGEERKRWENLHRAPAIREELKRVLLDPSIRRDRAETRKGGS